MPLHAHHHEHVGDVLDVPAVPVVSLALTGLVQLLHRPVLHLDVLPVPVGVGVEAIPPEGTAPEPAQFELLARDGRASIPVLAQYPFLLAGIRRHVRGRHDVIARHATRGTHPPGRNVARPLLPPLHEAGVAEGVIAAREYAIRSGRLEANAADERTATVFVFVVANIFAPSPSSTTSGGAIIIAPMHELAVLAEATRSGRVIGAGDGLERHLAREQPARVVGKSTGLPVSTVTVLEEETTEGRGTRRRGWGSRGKGGERNEAPTAPTAATTNGWATRNVPSFACPFVCHGRLVRTS